MLCWLLGCVAVLPVLVSKSREFHACPNGQLKRRECREKDFNKYFALKYLAGTLIRTCGLSTCAALTLLTDDHICPPAVPTHICALTSSQYSGGPWCGCCSHSFYCQWAYPEPTYSERVGVHDIAYNPTLPGLPKAREII